MVTIRHVSGPARFTHAALDSTSIHGDTHEVSDGGAEYLCDALGHFERLDVTEAEFREIDGNDAGDTAKELESADDKTDAMLIEAGECPWCDDYEGENVGQHASSAHPDLWDNYKEA